MKSQSLYLLASVVACGIALVALIGLFAIGWTRLDNTISRMSRDERATRAGLLGQTANRAANVLTWCNAINRESEYNRIFVREVTHGTVIYSLPDLPCKALAAKTTRSARIPETN